MPHKCVKCEQVYDDDLPEVAQGCPCGSKVFLYVRKERFERLKHITSMRDGKYDINLGALFGRSPEENHEEVDRTEDGKYTIDLERAFGRRRE